MSRRNSSGMIRRLQHWQNLSRMSRIRSCSARVSGTSRGRCRDQSKYVEGTALAGSGDAEPFASVVAGDDRCAPSRHTEVGPWNSRSVSCSCVHQCQRPRSTEKHKIGIMNGRLDLPRSLTAATVKSCACAGLHALRPGIKLWAGRHTEPGVRTSASRSGPETIALPLLKSRERSPPVCEHEHGLERLDASVGLGPSPVRVHIQYRAIALVSILTKASAPDAPNECQRLRNPPAFVRHEVIFHLLRTRNSERMDGHR